MSAPARPITDPDQKDPTMPSPTAPVRDPSPILQTAFGFWSSKVLLTAVEMGLFTVLGVAPADGGGARGELGLHPRGIATSSTRWSR